VVPPAADDARSGAGAAGLAHSCDAAEHRAAGQVMVTAAVLYYLFYTQWMRDPETPSDVVLEMLQRYFIFYIIFNAVTSTLLILKRFPAVLVQWVVFTVGLVDGLLLAGLTAETGGFSSSLFWVFPGLIVLNALSIPLATPQIVLNLSLSVFYVGRGW